MAFVSERTPPSGAIHLAPTKISPPRFDDRLARRERLDRVLDRGGRVTLVVAPAGYGKTVAVSQWAQRVVEPVAWYTVDEHDRTAERFWRYLAASLGRVVPSLGAETIRSIDEWAVDGDRHGDGVARRVGGGPCSDRARRRRGTPDRVRPHRTDWRSSSSGCRPHFESCCVREPIRRSRSLAGEPADGSPRSVNTTWRLSPRRPSVCFERWTSSTSTRRANSC